MKLLLVEDEPEIARLLKNLLHNEKYVVDHVDCQDLAREALRLNTYSLVILDRMLPDGDGIELVKFAKKNNIICRFLILSALGEIMHKVEGLDLGADDYLAKPFEPSELLARIRAAMRRPIKRNNPFWTCQNVKFDRQSMNVFINDVPTKFSRKELLIIESLIRAKNRVVTRDSLEAAIYGFEEEIQSNTMESHISRLRKKLKINDAKVSIIAVRGVGYMMEEDDA